MVNSFCTYITLASCTRTTIIEELVLVNCVTNGVSCRQSVDCGLTEIVGVNLMSPSAVGMIVKWRRSQTSYKTALPKQISPTSLPYLIRGGVEKHEADLARCFVQQRLTPCSSGYPQGASMDRVLGAPLWKETQATLPIVQDGRQWS